MANLVPRLALIACASCRLGFDASSDASSDTPAGFFKIGGVISGLTSEDLALQNNGSDDLRLTENGPFTFATSLAAAEPYNVSVVASPSGQDCLVSNGIGVADDLAKDRVGITCFVAGACPTEPVTFTVNDTFAPPGGCASMTVEAHGGGGAGGARNQGLTAAAGGNGGHALLTFSGVASTIFTITIGAGGICASTVDTTGGYGGGRGGDNGGSGTGGNGAGTTSPPGGMGGLGSTGGQPGGAGGNGGYGGGGGGGGGDNASGNSAGAATSFQLASPLTDYIIAGGGGGAGTADQNGDVSGSGGVACTGYVGADGAASGGGNRSGGGGGGGACYCLGGTCDSPPTPGGGTGGVAGTSSGCTPAQNGSAGKLVITLRSI